jgi:hypothetical protein
VLLSGWENLLEPYTLLVMADGSLTTVRDLPEAD